MGIDIKSSSVSSTNLSQNPQTTGGSISSAKTNMDKSSVKSVKAVENRELEQTQKGSEKSSSEVRGQLQEWVSKMNVTINEKVKFAYSEDFGGIYVTVVDNETQEVIRKIPTEDAIKLSAIWKEAIGNIFDSKG